ncbi:MAG: hypothetical protein OXG68_01025 [Chloroflexi bacterium]|nr:hypothetical protein [Chloroflexota bacterium]
MEAMSYREIKTWKGMKTTSANISNFARAKETWWCKHRPSIMLLLDADENFHDTALLLMIPCMEKVYALENNLSNKSNVSLAEVVKRFFPYWDEEQCDLFRKYVANGLKHDSFVRPHSFSVTSSAKDEARPFLPISIKVSFHHPEFGEQTTLSIDKVSFWNRLYPQIDNFYSEMWKK